MQRGSISQVLWLSIMHRSSQRFVFEWSGWCVLACDPTDVYHHHSYTHERIWDGLLLIWGDCYRGVLGSTEKRSMHNSHNSKPLNLQFNGFQQKRVVFFLLTIWLILTPCAIKANFFDYFTQFSLRNSFVEHLSWSRGFSQAFSFIGNHDSL